MKFAYSVVAVLSALSTFVDASYKEASHSDLGTQTPTVDGPGSLDSPFDQSAVLSVSKPPCSTLKTPVETVMPIENGPEADDQIIPSPYPMELPLEADDTYDDTYGDSPLDNDDDLKSEKDIPFDHYLSQSDMPVPDDLSQPDLSKVLYETPKPMETGYDLPELNYIESDSPYQTIDVFSGNVRNTAYGILIGALLKMIVLY